MTMTASTATAPATRPATCKVCSKSFLRLNSMQSVCGVKCARQVPVIAKRAAREADAKKREALKTRQQWVREAQAEFNAYVRLRDAGKSCICCGSWGAGAGSRGGDWDAGHYRSTGSAPHLRFDEDNCHRQLKKCNRYGAGRAVDYRIGLIARIGLASVERLESDQAPRKFTVDELRALRDAYRAKAKALRALDQS